MRFEQRAVVDAPAHVVWRVLAAVETWPTWTDSISSVRLLDGDGLALGRRVRIKQPRFPHVVWTVTELEPGRSFSWTAGGPGMTTVAAHVIAPIDAASCAVTVSVDQQGILGGVFSRLTAATTQRYLRMEAAGLKARAEQLHLG